MINPIANEPNTFLRLIFGCKYSACLRLFHVGKGCLEPGAPHGDNVYPKTPAEPKHLSISKLPRTLDKALNSFEADPLSRSVMGETLPSAQIKCKRAEWHA